MLCFFLDNIVFIIYLNLCVLKKIHVLIFFSNIFWWKSNIILFMFIFLSLIFWIFWFIIFFCFYVYYFSNIFFYLSLFFYWFIYLLRLSFYNINFFYLIYGSVFLSFIFHIVMFFYGLSCLYLWDYYSEEDIATTFYFIHLSLSRFWRWVMYWLFYIYIRYIYKN